MEPWIEVQGLHKRFRVRADRRGFFAGIKGLAFPETREVTAIESLSFSVARGERVAFIGPNGAGKSTTSRCCPAFFTPTRGHVRVLGLVPWEARRALGFRIGTVFGQRSQLWYHLPPNDTFELLAHVYELDRSVFRHGATRWSTPFPSRHCSEARAAALARRAHALRNSGELLHRPSVLFLDEPTIGLDGRPSRSCESSCSNNRRATRARSYHVSRHGRHRAGVRPRARDRPRGAGARLPGVRPPPADPAQDSHARHHEPALELTLPGVDDRRQCSAPNRLEVDNDKADVRRRYPPGARFGHRSRHHRSRTPPLETIIQTLYQSSKKAVS